MTNTKNIAEVTVVGAGAMGRQIALHTARFGYRVRLYDVSAKVVAAASSWAAEYLEGRIQKGRMSAEQVAAIKERLIFDTDLAQAVHNADLVVEAVAEDLTIKRQVFADLDRLAPPHAILATNSSTIASSKLVDATSRPDLVANLHYFNPALVMEVVEVVQGPHTSPETAQRLVDFVRQTDKRPIHMQKEIPGFVANRLLHALAREAFFLLENGYATHEDIDLAAEKALGHPMGPFRLMDLTGLDIGYRVRMEKYRETGDPADKPPSSLEEKYKRGEFGRKTGKGWYTYGDGS